MKVVRGKKYNCGQCGKKLTIYDIHEWAYQIRDAKVDGKRKTRLMFCSYSCQESFKKEHPQPKEYRRMK